MLNYFKGYVMSNSLDIDDMDYYPSCDSCGAEFCTQDDIDGLVYSRTTADSDHYICSECGEEKVDIISKT